MFMVGIAGEQLSALWVCCSRKEVSICIYCQNVQEIDTGGASHRPYNRLNHPLGKS